MYIIVEGGVNVRLRRYNIAHKEENPVVVSLYDGVQFGELSLQTTYKPKGLLRTLVSKNENAPTNLKMLGKEISNSIATTK